jgi:hypothetical protein
MPVSANPSWCGALVRTRRKLPAGNEGCSLWERSGGRGWVSRSDGSGVILDLALWRDDKSKINRGKVSAGAG